MAANCREIIHLIENKYPLEIAESYDNVGLIIGNFDSIISKVLVCLDVTDAVVDEAINNNVNMIISHHPIIFKPFKKLTSDNYISSLIMKIIKSDICIYALHTNFDNATDGMNDILAELIGLSEINKLGKGTGRYGILYNSMLLIEFCDLVKNKLRLKSLKVTGDLNSIVKRIAVVGGAGSDFIDDAIASDCHVILTGDIKHHSALDGKLSGINIIDAGHYFTEIVALPYIANYIHSITGIETIITKVNTNPFNEV